jgi:hypothetical protein
VESGEAESGSRRSRRSGKYCGRRWRESRRRRRGEAARGIDRRWRGFSGKKKVALLCVYGML